MSEPALVMSHVSVRYEPDDPPILVDISLEVAPGEKVALLGLNGSGKTTLLIAAVGLLPHEGSITVCGLPLSRATLGEVRRRVGFLFNVPEDQLLFPKVLDDVAFALTRQGEPAAQAAAQAQATLEALGIGQLGQASLHHLSHGQKQRVALAGALVAAQPLLLLDEPSAALDPPAKRGLARLLAAQPAAMIVATHDIEFAAWLCTRFVTIENGRIAADQVDAAEVRRRWDRA
jgi:cobalt/nickel transport system ATP-binding protein